MSPLDYLDSESIPEGFTMKDPSKWMKADLGLLWDQGEEVGGAGIPGPSVTQHSVGGPSEQAVDGAEVLGEPTADAGQSNPEESSPAWHASKDCICYLKSLSIMPRYQVLVDLVDALPEQEHGKGTEVDFPHWATWTWSAKYFPQEIHLDLGTF
ncbi:hypothetical protein F5141DRAFT_1222574 [Pisolithus sp. B1]|nr:hypothetical protein F5141DRAFT_1222574 [Pisolithus sp. B1]